jgi:hypothetical protein
MPFPTIGLACWPAAFGTIALKDFDGSDKSVSFGF